MKDARRSTHGDERVEMRLRLGRQTDARRRLGIVRHEKVRSQRLAWVDPVGIEIADPLTGEEGVVDQKSAGEAFGWLLEDQMGGVGENLRLARHANDGVATSRFLIAAVAMVVRGHSALTAIPLGRSSPASPSTTMLMPNFAIV